MKKSRNTAAIARNLCAGLIVKGRHGGIVDARPRTAAEQAQRKGTDAMNRRQKARRAA